MRLNCEGQGVGQRANHQRLGQARHADQQAMPAGEHRHQQLLDHLLLADDDLGQLGGDLLIRLVQAVHGLQVVVGWHAIYCIRVRCGSSCRSNATSLSPLAINNTPPAKTRFPPVVPRGRSGISRTSFGCQPKSVVAGRVSNTKMLSRVGHQT